MRAAVLHAIGQPLRIEEVPVPRIGPEDVLVRSMACGICGTDLHIRDGWGYTPKLPFIMGHEVCGIVADAGEKVSGFKAGDRVVPNNFFTCGNCFYCRTNRETQCIQLDGILGVLKHSGGYAEYFRIPARQLFHLPESIAFTEGGVIADAVVTAVHGVRRGRVAPGETVAVISIGGCSSAAIQVCKAYGARVISIVRSSKKAKRARELGADETIVSRQLDVVETLSALTGGQGVACVIDGVGVEETLRQGINGLRNAGRLVILGYSQEHYSVDPRQVAVRELEVIGTRSGGREDTVEAIRLVGSPDWKPIVTDTFPVEDVEAAHTMLREARALGRIALLHEEQALRLGG